MERSPNDEQLVCQMVQGNREALGELYDRFAHSLSAAAQRILGSQREAEDIVHDVFLEAWQRAPHYDRSRGSVRTWLMLRLRSRSIDRLRAARRFQASSFEDGTGDDDNRTASTAEATLDSTLLKALASLSYDQRLVLQLSFFAGQSCEDIAAVLNVPVGTVKSRLSRALSQLRTQLVFPS